MNLTIVTALSLLVLASVLPADDETLTVTRSAARPSRRGPAEFFTGAVRIEPLFDAKAPSRTSGASVTFEPGARTAWHTHPLGQTLVVTAGVGRCQRWGDPAQEIRAGDVVWIPPGQKHWHGASPDAAMTHLAIQEGKDGTFVQWLEHVSDEQYGGRAARLPPEPGSGQRADEGGGVGGAHPPRAVLGKRP